MLAVVAAAPSAEAFPSVRASDGGVVLHEHFVELHRGSLPPDLVGLARLDAQGEMLRGFGRNGFRVERAAPGAAHENAHLAMDEGGRISVAVTSSGSRAARVRRYLGDGSLDWSFGGDGEVEVEASGGRLEATELVALPGGALLLGGGLTAEGAQRRTLALARIEAGGSLDLAFGGGDGIATADDAAGSSAASRIRLTEGGILAGGDGLVARFTGAGLLDESFGSSGMMRGSLAGVVDAAGDGAVIAAQAPVPEEGIVIERLRPDGSPDPSWGDDGRTTLRLSAKDFDLDPDGNLFGNRITYAVAEVVSLDDGRVVVGATEYTEPYDYDMAHCGENRAAPVVLSAGGELERMGAGPPARLEHLLPLPGGDLLVTGDIEWVFNCGFDPGYAHYGQVGRYDANLDLVSWVSVRPVVEPPLVEIASGPPPVSGPDVVFRFSVTPGPRDTGEVALECALDGAGWTGCPVELPLRALGAGPHSLRVRARGIHGAPSDERIWRWSVFLPPPVVLSPGEENPTAAIMAYAAADAREIGRTIRRLGARRLAQRRRFPVTADATQAGVWRAGLAVLLPGPGPARAVTVARSRAAFAGPRAKRVAVRLTRRGRRLLRRSQRAVRLQVKVSFSPIGRPPLSTVTIVRVTPAGRNRSK